MPLFITQFLGAFNDNAFRNTFLVWYTYQALSFANLDTPLVLNLATALLTLPFFLFSAMAGQLADKYQRITLTRYIKFVEIVLMALSLFFFLTLNVGGLLFLIFMMGLQSTFFGPIKYSLLPVHLRKNELLTGNSLVETGTFLAILLGTLLGGLVILLDQGLWWVGSVMIGLAFIGWLASLSIPVATVRDPDLKVAWNILSSSWRIIRYSTQDKRVWYAILGCSWFWLIGSVLLTQLPYYTERTLAGDTSILTLFLLLFSLGVGAGAFACNYLLKGALSIRWVPISLLGISVFGALLVIASYGYLHDAGGFGASAIQNAELLQLSDFLAMGFWPWLISLSLFLLSASGGMYILPLYTVIQQYGEPSHLSRLVAANNIVNAIFIVSGSLCVSLLYIFGADVLMVLMLFLAGNLIVYMLALWAIRSAPLKG
ncbi:MAG: MFS transporter [Gammaproteobacteria bacterium]